MMGLMVTSGEGLMGEDCRKIAIHPRIDNFQMSDLWSVHWLRSLAGWNQTAGFWEALSAAGSAELYVARLGGIVVGSASLWFYGRDLAWIGMVIVHPAYRGCRIGTALLHHCLRRADEAAVATVGLDATPAGRGLYRQLGFVEGERLDRWVIDGAVQSSCVVSLGDSLIAGDEGLDPLLVSSFDRDATGVERSPLLSMLKGDCLGVRCAFSAAGDVLGYGCLQPGAIRPYLGPVLAENATVGRGLVGSLLERVGKLGAFWDIPANHSAACATARQLGFSRARPLYRMWRSEAIRAARPDRVWGIVDPALG